MPEVEKPGDAANGKMLFTGACSSCHKLGDIGKSEAGPPLNGMGAHGRAELLAHIVDPNREVDPSFWQWNVTTRKGETLAGVIASENAASLTLRNAAGDVEIKKDDIATRENTRRSLMPEGLEALGRRGAARHPHLPGRRGNDQKFRVVDLRQAYTADSRRGFRREEERDETVTLHKFGDVSVAGVPFFVMDPARSPSGANLIALEGWARPRQSLGRLPAAGRNPDDRHRGQPAFSRRRRRLGLANRRRRGARHARDEGHRPFCRRHERGARAQERRALRRYLRPRGSAAQHRCRRLHPPRAAALLRVEPRQEGGALEDRAGELRHRHRPCHRRHHRRCRACRGTAPRPDRSSADRRSPSPGCASQTQPASATPKEGGRGDAPLPETKPIVWAAGKTKVLIIGGGSSHNFGQFFGGTDSATLEAAGFSVNYTEDRDQAAAEIGKADVAVISVNRQFFDTPAYRKALFDFAAAGKGLVMLHPGTWYGFAQWPELNATIVGGGARGHDRIAKFSVNAVKPDHPVMKGVPASFEVEDELYYMNAEADKIPPGTAPIEVLAETSPSVRFKQPHPAVWITRHPTARIVGITLGHDERVHDHQAFKTLLANAVKWAGGAR